MRLTYADGRTGLDTTAFRYKLTDDAGVLVKDWTTGATWTEEPAGTYFLDDEDAAPGTVYAVEPTEGAVGGVGRVPNSAGGLTEEEHQRLFSLPVVPDASLLAVISHESVANGETDPIGPTTISGVRIEAWTKYEDGTLTYYGHTVSDGDGEWLLEVHKGATYRLRVVDSRAHFPDKEVTV